MIDQVPAPGARPIDAILDPAPSKPSIVISAGSELLRTARLIRRATGRLLTGG